MNAVHAIVDYLNANPAFIAFIAAVAAVMVQYAINHFKALGKFTNYVLALVAIPGVTTALAAYITPLHLEAYPAVVLLAQISFAVWEKIQANAVAKAQANFTNTPLPVAEPTVTEY